MVKSKISGNYFKYIWTILLFVFLVIITGILLKHVTFTKKENFDNGTGSRLAVLLDNLSNGSGALNNHPIATLGLVSEFHSSPGNITYIFNPQQDKQLAQQGSASASAIYQNIGSGSASASASYKETDPTIYLGSAK